MKKLTVFALALSLIVSVNGLLLAQEGGQGLATEKSVHNFSHESWKSIAEICNVCHILHDESIATERYLNGLRWNQEISSFTFNMYNSSWGASLVGARDESWISPITRRHSGLPDGLSKLCLGCHDGVVAPFFDRHHFVSVEYDVTRTSLRDPDVTKMGLSGLISDVLYVGKVQCASCHDVHDEESVPGTKLLRDSKDKLCKTCHKIL
jgi:predicted CXXCH cytochrome family protein